MRGLDETPIDPEVADVLGAIDAALDGDPVDPRHAELGELALLVAGERPAPNRSFSTALDERVEQRFVKSSPPSRASRRRWLVPIGGLGAAAVAVVVTVVVLSGGPGRQPLDALTSASSSSGAPAPLSSRAVPRPAPAAKSPRFGSATAPVVTAAAPAPGAAVPAPASALTLASPANGRKIIQAAQLSVTTSPGRVDVVAQEVFDVVGQANGVVDNSSVTAGGPGGYAQFQLSIPSASLPRTMAALSALRYARVASRTDTTQDVNDQYTADVRRLADARALRTALLKQLASATTQSQIGSLTARIHDAEASISSDEATLRRLNRQVDYSQVTLSINAGSAPVAGSHGDGGFTIGKAAHDAGHVLTVAAGVALIAAAALVPLALLGALALWIATAVRRRRRDQALDTV
jgi:hypothetical protein